MYSNTFMLLSLGAASAAAFQNTSPFFLASTSHILDSSQTQLQTASSLLDNLAPKLSACPSDYYVIASQPGVHSADFTGSRSAPRLGDKMLQTDKTIKSSLIVNEVVGVLDASQIGDMIERACGADRTVVDAETGSYPSSFGTTPRIIMVDFPMLSLGSDRKRQLSDNDGLLADIIDRIPTSKYTLLYATSPRESPDSNQAEDVNDVYQDPVHMELKRDYSMHLRDGSGNNNSSGSGSKKSLFEKYQYFTPGLFMGLLVSFFCLTILYVGFSALASLKVPYAAFERDTSSTVQRKQQ